MIPFRLYLSLGLVVLGVALAAYVSHLRSSLADTRVSLAAATEAASRVETYRTADTEALDSLQKATTKTLVVTKEIVREVLVRIPADACPLPVDWRVLHDAAAAGEAPEPPAGPAGAASGAEAAPR